MTCGSFGAAGMICPGALRKRFVTSRKTVAEYIGPLPDCARYVKCMVDYNCPPLVEFEWLRNGEPIPDPTETEIMAMTIIAPGAPAPVCKSADVLPLRIVGPAGPFTYAEIQAQALAAAPVDYNFGTKADPILVPAADDDDILALNISVAEMGQSFLLNGNPSGGVNDPDGVNRDNLVEVPAGCAIDAAFCLQSCLTKAEIAAL